MSYMLDNPEHTRVRHVASGAVFPYSPPSHLHEPRGRTEREWEWVNSGRPLPAAYVAPPKVKSVDDADRRRWRDQTDVRNRRG